MAFDPTAKPRFYGRRQGRPLNPGRQEAMDEMVGLYGIKLDLDQIPLESLEPSDLFKTNTPEKIWLEVGFGNGEHLIAQAQAHPEIGFIGCEPFINGVSALYKEIKDKNIHNIRVWADDVRPFFDRLKQESLERVFVLFPDPWPKTRHHKRRFINQDNLTKIARVLKEDGLLRMATDHAGLATWMLEECLEYPDLYWTAQSKDDWQKEPDDWLVRTRYQEKAKAGIVNWFIECQKKG